MSFLSGIGGSTVLSFAAEAALGVATGGTSLAVQAALKAVTMAVGDAIIQQVGQEIGLPQSVIGLAQAAFHAEAGDVGGAAQSLSGATSDLAGAVGGDSFDSGALEQQAQSGVDQAANDALAQMQLQGIQNSGGQENIAQAAKGKSLLIAMAIALGKVADDKMKQMYDDSQKLGDLKAGDKGYAQLTGEIQGLGQEISLITNALNNAIKSIGEGATTLARKS